MNIFNKILKGFIKSSIISSSTTMINSFNGSTCSVNGKTYKGNSISIINNRVLVDGKEVDDLSKFQYLIFLLF